MDAMEDHELSKLLLAPEFEKWRTAFALEPSTWGNNWLGGVKVKIAVAAWNAGVAAGTAAAKGSAAKSTDFESDY